MVFGETGVQRLRAGKFFRSWEALKKEDEDGRIINGNEKTTESYMAYYKVGAWKCVHRKRSLIAS